MREYSAAQANHTKICLLGASFDTGNLGVSALAESSIKCILNRWPDAEVTLLASSRTEQHHRLNVAGMDITVEEFPIRFSKKFWLANHFCVMIFYTMVAKLLPLRRVKNALMARNKYYKTIAQAELAVDIAGGDSFSDIYGIRRFVFGLLYKVLVLQSGKKLITLPQTYGPFKTVFTKGCAKYVLKRVTTIYSRDLAGIEYLRNLLKNHNSNGKIRFLPDVAFILDRTEPERFTAGDLLEGLNEKTVVVGLNISGLLFNGGYTRDNMFGLKTNYRKLIYEIIELLLKHSDVVVLLIPHVFPQADNEVESDPAACSEVFQKMSKKHPDRIFLTQGKYNHNEIKYIIGLCDFFIGSRMHACIAAMSQYIPAVGVAYSKKFEGVFESIHLADCVADARHCDEKELLEKIESVFEQRDLIRKHLQTVIPGIQEEILNIFKV